MCTNVRTGCQLQTGKRWPTMDSRLLRSRRNLASASSELSDTGSRRISFINIRRTIWRETQARQDIYRIKLWDLGWVILLQEKFGNSQLGFLDLHTMGAYFSPVCWSIWETLGAIEVKVSSNTHILFGFFALESRIRFCWLPVTFSSYVFSLIFWYIDFFPPMTRCEWTSLIMVIQI